MNMFIIDTSYATYHCMFSAAKKIYGESNLTKKGYPENYNPLEDSSYVECLYEKFTNIVDYRENVCKCNIPMSNVVFAIDCPRHDIWRKDIFPSYKSSRDKKDPLFNTQPSKEYVLNTIIPIYTARGAIAIQSPRAEADDIIGAIVEENRNSDMHYVVSSDKDCMQLTGYNYKQFDANGTLIQKIALFKDVAKSAKFKDVDFVNEISDLTAKDMIFFKSLMGDSGDSINPVHKGCGPVKAYEYLRNRNVLNEQIKNNSRIKDNIILNTKLMNFKFIPNSIREDILYRYAKARAEC